MNNYHNRRARGQCASCTNPACTGKVRCKTCQDRHREQWQTKKESYNAIRRERAFQESIDRERRLDEIDARLKAEIAELLANQIDAIGRTGE